MKLDLLRALYARLAHGEQSMRFLMLNWRDPRNPLSGGAERVTLGYLAGLARRGHQVFWFTYDFSGAAPEEEIEGVKIIRRGGTGSSILEARRWARQQKRFDLVIDQIHGIPWYAPWWCGTRSIAYLHEVLGPIWDAFYKPPLNWIGKRQERFQYWLYRHVPFWTASTNTRDELIRCGAREVTVIPYGVQTEALRELEPKAMSAALRLVVVSRLAPNKRIDHAIRTLGELVRRKIDARLVIIGSGGMEPVLRELCVELGLTERVEFAGGLSEADKDARLRQAHLLLHASQREGWGLNVVEANAMGTPAVVYPVKGLVESTLHDVTGRVAAAEDPTALADAVEIVVQNPELYQRYRIRAWERAKTFHWSQVQPRACEWLEQQARRPWAGKFAEQ